VKQGDGFIYSSTLNNGFNIISQPGTGTDDYIRFFAGQASGAAGTPDLYIQGSGATRGFVGFNNENPLELLHAKGGDVLIENSNGKIFSELSLPGRTIFNISGNSTSLTQYDVESEGSGGIIFGIRGSGETGIFSSAVGKQGDGFIYSSIQNNGFNIVSQPTSPQTTDDYIRFFAGQFSGASGIPDIHIQGSGATRGYVGLGTGDPTEKLHVEDGDIFISNTYGIVYSELGIASPNDIVFAISGNSGQLTEHRVSSQSSGGISIGVRGITEPSFPTYGKLGDSYIYSTVSNNGINIISERTSPQTTDDYIRLYAGQSALGTSHLHIQGSGTTGSVVRGNIGINNEAPTSKLDIIGDNGYNQLRIRTSYTPTSTADANGEIGDISWDNSYFYIKTGTGWGRISLDYVF
jgi:hypothetical protein